MELSAGSYLGRTIRQLATRDVALIESRYAPGAALPEHRHDRPYLCFVMAGGFDEQVGGREFRCPAGTVVLHLGERSHRDRFGAGGGRCLNLEADASWLADRLPASLNRIDRWQTSAMLSWGRLRRLHAWMARSRGELDDAGQRRQFEDDAMELLRGLHPAPDANGAAAAPAQPIAEALPDWWLACEQRLAGDLSQRRTVAATARLAGVRADRLGRWFMKRHGCTAAAARRARRIEVAAQRLLETGQSLAAIAGELGFCDQAHFTRVFSRAIGISPARYRSQLR